MTKKHFTYAAQIVSEMKDRMQAQTAADAYARLFRAFNPLFDVDRFLAACGLAG